uniref:BTB domain-containing protein n=1 Tax=Panagrolaimus davidi TaxID=227884 RepID=A0A914PJG1_9BILA
MFESGMKEFEEKKVTIKDFSYEIVETAIKYCYNSNLVTDPILENKMKILQFFDKYNIQLLKDDLENFFFSEIHESNVCLLSNAALLSNSLKLEKKCFEFLQNCVSNKIAVSDFELLDKDFALKILKNAFYKISS